MFRFITIKSVINTIKRMTSEPNFVIKAINRKHLDFENGNCFYCIKCLMMLFIFVRN